MKTASNMEAGSFPFQLDEFYLDLQEDGSRVSMLSQEEITKRPFPGLRPFKTSEFQLFNGRVGQAEELIKRLKKNRFLAVIGSSGTGKSSLVRAGLIPQLFGGYLHGAGSKWNIAICRPGKDPIENLAIALSGIKTHSSETKELIDNFNDIEPRLSSSIYGLLDVKEILDKEIDVRNTDKSPSNLLIIIDQFEELFRFERTDLEKENIESQFVNLLLKASLDPGNAVYVIITMRSEFLGDCVKYRGLPEAINEGQYLVPQLTRNELKEVIENPIKLAGKKIAPTLVELLVNEIEESKLKENLDQLPILQHALMRTYNEAMKYGPDTEISYEHYKKIGEMEMALANHAESIFNALGDAASDGKHLSKKQQLAKMIFQSLTELGSGQKGGRRPTELKNIYAIAASMNASEKEVDEVVDHFRDSDTSFIMPPINTKLYPGLIIDISHESLMRNWKSLTDWMTEEMKFGNLYKQLNERRERYEFDKEERLRGMLLRDLLDWKESYANNATWASRYHQLPKKMNDPALHESLYKKNIDFLNESRDISEQIRIRERKELQENLERAQKAKAAKTRATVLTVAAIISFLFGFWAFAERNNARKQENIAKQQQKIADLNADSARIQRRLAEANAEEARNNAVIARANAEEAKKNADLANKQIIIAEEQGKIAEAKSIIAFNQKQQLEKYAEQDRIRTQQQLNFVKKKNSDFEKQLVKNALKNEQFYFSPSLDQATKEEIIDSLFNTPSFDATQVELGKYIDLTILKLINEAVRAKENVSIDRDASIATAQEIWSDSHHPILKKLLLGIVNENIFSGESVQAASVINLDIANLSVSKNGFAFNNERQLVTGKNQNGMLLINENSFDVPISNLFCNSKNSIYKNKNFAWFGFTDNNKVVAIVDSFHVKLGPDGKVETVETMPGVSNYAATQLSPNGQLMVILDRDGNVKLKSTPGSSEKVDTTVGNYRNKLSGNENMFFSPNSQYIYLNVGGKPRIINKKTTVTGMADWDNEEIAAAVFTADSRNVIVVAEGKISVRDSSLGHKKAGYEEINIASALFRKFSVIPKEVNSIIISQNWKKMLLAQKNGRIYLLENKNGDSLFAKNNTGDENLRIKEIRATNWDKFKAAFYNDSAVITINNMGKISLWNIYPDFNDPGIALAAVSPKMSFKRKLESNSISVQEVLASANAAELNIAADHYFLREDIDTAKMVWQKLLDNAPPEMRVYYLGKLIEMNTEANNVARINSAYSTNKNGFNSIKEYRIMRHERYTENVAFLKQQSMFCPDNNDYKEALSTAYGGLAFNKLFINDFSGAIRSAKTGLELSPEKNDWIYTNLALGNLLSGKYKEAEKIYLEYKDRQFTDGRMSFRTGFTEDLRDLETGGVFIGLSDSILADIAKIRVILSPDYDIQPFIKKAKKG